MKIKNRIKKAQEFERIIHHGNKVVNRSFVFYYDTKVEEEARFGISVSKKLGHAVDRNLYKRQVRMMVQELVDFNDCKIDGILIIRCGYKSNDYSENKKNLEKLLLKATMK